MKMGKNKLAPKLCVGFVMFIMVMSVFSGAISAVDLDIKATDSAIDARTKNTKNNKLDYFKATTSAKADNGISVLSYRYDVDLKNQTKKVHVAISNSSDLGKFTMGGYYNGQWQKLLYGYPSYGSTSYLTVQVENATASVNYTNADYMMDQYVVEHVHGIGDDAVAMKWRLPGDIIIMQKIQLIHDFARIEIDATNEGSSTKKIGVRYYYDTQVAWSDDAPIYIPGEGVKTTQEEYINPTFTYWKGYDNPTEPTVVSEAKISGADATPPDKLQIDDYGSAQAWDNSVDPGDYFSDSAVLTYWNPTDVAPGQSKQVVTYYGIGAPVARGPFNISEIMVDRVDGNYCPGENVTIKVDVISIGKTHEGSVKIEVLYDGNVLYSSLPKSTGAVPADDATTILFNYSVGVDACNKRLNIKASLLNSSTLSLIDEMTKSAMIIVDQSCPECATKPDLAVNVITWSPDIICDGDPVAVNATIVNNGTDNAADFYVRFEVDGNYIGRKLISGLSVGANTTITQNWLACAGSHNVTVYVDEYNVIEESDDTNNKMTADLPFIQFPDLTVTNITWTPTDIVGGDTVTFTATVTNIGAGSTSSDFYVRFEVDGKSIRPVKVADGLDSGSSTEVTQTWTATWASTINVSVDEEDAVVESDETNNKMSKALPGLPFPDLNVTNLTWEPKENVNSGDPVTFTATIENTGGRFHSTMSKPLKIAFLVNDEYVGSRNIVGGIRTGQPLNTTFTWSAQPGTNPEVCVVADYSNMIPESNENNNELCETITLTIKSPDLTITQLTFEPTGSIHVGDTVQFRAKVGNIGAGDYNGDFDIGFYVGDVYAGVTHVANGVPAGESIFSTFNWTASSCSDPVIIAKADFFDTVRESDKANNEKTATLPASVPYADLAITGINWSPGEDIKDRYPVTFNVTVKNRGSGTVITDFSVYFDIDGYFTRTNVISGGLAAGESKTTSFTWKATPGDGHNATAKADPDNVVPESDKANNERVQLLPFNVSLVELFEVKVEPAEITTGIGGQTRCKIKISNYGSASGNFDINVSGLDSDWYTLSTTSLYLSAGQEGVIDLIISVPEACENSGTFPLQVTVTSHETAITRQGSANLIVEPTPVIHDLLPRDRASLGSDDVTFSWDTYINSSSTIYLKSEDETDYTTYAGAEGQLHTAVVSSLARDKNYSYYAESTAPCGTFNSSVRTFYIGNGICFTRDIYEFTVERDYDQHVTIGVRNTDNEYHELLVGVPTTYDDLVLGFVGDGSKDNIIPLNPGESKDIALAVHLQDAMKEDYELMANLTSTKGDETLTDTTRIKIHVHVPRIDYDIEEISVDEITLMQTFRLTNTGDPVTDLTVSVADNLKENAYIEPVIEHYRLSEGASVEFNVVPILSSPDFQPASPVPPVEGDITVNAARIEARKEVCFTIPEGKQPYKAIVGGSGTMSGSGINAAASSPGVINIGRVKTWHCNNRPNTRTSVDVHSGAKDKVRDDPLIIRFSSPGWEGEVKPHDLYISINGHDVGSLINTVPEGYYKFEVDPSFLIYPERGVAKNYIELHSVHQNGGHYAVSSDMEVRLNLENYETWVIASSQEEANQIAAENLPPGFYESPDSVTIGEVEIVPEEGGSAVLSALSATSQVYLGKPTTIQTTAEPHLDVDAMFGNGDGTVHLAEVSGGVYKGTWTPQNPGDSDCVVTIRAKGSGVQDEKTQTVKINEPTKLYLTINEPEDGKEISLFEKLWNKIIGYCYGVQQPIKVTVTDDVGSEITPSDVEISGNVVITREDGTRTEQPLTNWAFEGNGKFRYDWRPKCPGEYEITVYARDKDSSGERKGLVYAMGNSHSTREIAKATVRVSSILYKLKIEALDDFDIKKVKDPIWSTVNPKQCEPIADGIKTSTLWSFSPSPGSFKIRATIDVQPRPSWNPSLKYSWSIPGTSVRGMGNDPVNWGDSVEFDVMMPPKVGKYTLKLDFSICDESRKEKYSKTTSHILYATYLKSDLTKPKEEWLDNATKWATGAKNEKQVLIYLTQGIYNDEKRKWVYKAKNPEGLDLLDGKASEGNCGSFADLWINAAKILGVCGTIPKEISKSPFFVTKSGLNALDGTSGNAYQVGRGRNQCDRWVFPMHKVGYKSGWCYDPTFGKTYRNIEYIIEWEVKKEVWQKGKVPYYVVDDHKLYPKHMTPKNSPEWNIYEYHSPSDLAKNNPNYGAVFTGDYATYGMDSDGDGIYNVLTIDAEVNVTTAGNYSIMGWLRSDDTVITLRSSSDSTKLLGYAFSVSKPGLKNVTLNFSGEDIFDSGIDGIYTVDLFILDEYGYVIDNRSFNTPSYTYTEFGEIPARMNISKDYGEDVDGNGLFEYLTTEVDVKATRAMNYSIEGILYSNESQFITSVAIHPYLENSEILKLNFDGTIIRKSNKDGPYYLDIVFYDENGNQIGYKGYNTSIYSYTDFQELEQRFTGAYSDYGTDTDGDGLFDYLTVEVGIDIPTPGDYTISGWLYDSTGNAIEIATNDTPRGTGTQSVILNFNGLSIFRNNIDGPYYLKYLSLDSNEYIDFVEDACTTSAYNYTQFEGYPVDPTLIESDIVFTPETPTDGETVIITATIHNTGTDDVGSVVVVQFFDGDPNAVGDQIGCDQTVSSIPAGGAGSAQIYWTAIPGTHDIFVRVDPYDSIQEANENNNQAHKPITIEPTYNQLPIASFTYSPLNPTVNETITFNASNSYDPDGFIVNYEWDFGDDTAATGEIVEHTYSKPGDYIVILRVTNNASLSNTNTMILTISTTTSVETAVCGDVTGDNNVTMGDARRIEMWLLYPVDYPINNLWAADVTGDGEVTGDDARRIIMWLSDPEQYPLACSTP